MEESKSCMRLLFFRGKETVTILLFKIHASLNTITQPRTASIRLF